MSSRWSTNITPTERASRIVVGCLAALAGLVLLTGATSTLAVTLEVLTIVAGLDLVFPEHTGTALGTRAWVTCPHP